MVTPTLALLPGLDGTGDLFSFFLEKLPLDLRTEVISYPSQISSYDELTAFVRYRVAQLDSYVLLGESFSGPIAASIAAERSSRLVGCIFCASFLSCPSRLLSALGPLIDLIPIKAIPLGLIARKSFGEQSNDQLKLALANALAKTPQRTLIARLKEVRSVNFASIATKIEIPTLYLRPSSDLLVSARAADEVRASIPSLQFVDVPGPHFLLQASPEASAKAVMPFIKLLTTTNRATPNT